MPARKPELHQVLFWVLVAVCGWFAVRGVRTAIAEPARSDFTIFYAAGRAVLEGADPTAVPQFLYLPFYALCIAPLSALPFPVAMALWQLASLVLLVWIARECVALVARTGMDTPAWLAWAPLACVLRLVDSNLSYGQTNLIVFALVLAFLRAWSRGREASAGAWFGFATALKLVPGFLALHLVLARAWRALAAGALAALALVFLVPGLVFGFGRHARMLANWWALQTAPYAHGGGALLEHNEYVPGQSLTGTAYRLLSATPATSRGKEGPSAELVDLPPESVHAIVVGLSLAYVLVITLAILRSRREGRAGSWVREASLAILGALTLAPLVHKAHMLWAILPFTLVLAGAPRELTRPWIRVRWALVVLAVLLICATTPFLAGRFLSTWVLAHNSIFFGIQALFAVLLIDACCGQRRDATCAS